MALFFPEDKFQGQFRDDALERIRKSPDSYLDLDDGLKSDPEICQGTLLALNRYGYNSRSVLEILFQHAPDFSEHQLAFLRFAKLGDFQSIEVYFERFGSEIYRNRDFLKETIENDEATVVFCRLPKELRSDPELLTLEVENVRALNIDKFIRSVPSEALVENEFILFRALERKFTNFRPDQVPSSFWQNRDFIIKSLKKGDVPIACIPREFSDDREVCLCLCRSHMCNYTLDDVVDWIPKSFLADKSFVLECLDKHPTFFVYCGQELRDDFDVLFAAALRAIQSFPARHDFFYKLSEKSVSLLASSTRSRIEAHDEFMTFLVCCWKSSQCSVSPLSTLVCDDETSRGLKTIVAKYLGFPNTDYLARLERVLHQLARMVVERATLANELVPLIPPKALVKVILACIECHRPVALQTFPDELWKNQMFVEWAAGQGVFDNKISDEFSSNSGICLSYYRHSQAREKVLPWIAENLKSDPNFVNRCVRVDPMILSCCNKDDFRYYFDALREFVVRIAKEDGRLDDLTESARKNGWADALVFFAKALRVKIEANLAFALFEDSPAYQNLAKAGNANQLIGNYLCLIPSAKELGELELLWQNRCIFFLALGGSVDELCNAYTFRTKQVSNSDHEVDQAVYCHEEDPYEEDSYDGDPYDDEFNPYKDEDRDY
jgi:hypothetical protein